MDFQANKHLMKDIFPLNGFKNEGHNFLGYEQRDHYRTFLGYTWLYWLLTGTWCASCPPPSNLGLWGGSLHNPGKAHLFCDKQEEPKTSTANLWHSLFIPKWKKLKQECSECSWWISSFIFIYPSSSLLVLRLQEREEFLVVLGRAGSLLLPVNWRLPFKSLDNGHWCHHSLTSESICNVEDR